MESTKQDLRDQMKQHYQKMQTEANIEKEHDRQLLSQARFEINQDLARYHQSRARQIATKDANLQLIATKSQANRQQMQSELALGQ